MLLTNQERAVPNKQPLRTSIAALTFELVAVDGGVPTEAHLLPIGPFQAVDGRPGTMENVLCSDWQLDAAIAARVIARAAAQKTDILIDFEHQSLRSEWNGKRVEAAGWIPRTLEWREGQGLFALNISWVGDSADLIKQKKCRYISAVFLFNGVTGEILEIISVALTNTPAIDGLDALADLARKHSVFSTEEEADMADKEALAALTSERDGLNTKLAALTAERDAQAVKLAALSTERDALKTKVDAAEKEQAEAALAADKAKHTELLLAALTDGRLTPAQKVWAEKQTLADLTEYLDATNPLAILSKQTGGKDGGQGLTKEELDMCNRMGVTPEDYIKAKGKC
jgi:phage I-like protein